MKNGLIFQEQTCSRDKKLPSHKVLKKTYEITKSESKREKETGRQSKFMREEQKINVTLQKNIVQEMLMICATE